MRQLTLLGETAIMIFDNTFDERHLRERSHKANEKLHTALQSLRPADMPRALWFGANRSLPVKYDQKSVAIYNKAIKDDQLRETLARIFDKKRRTWLETEDYEYAMAEYYRLHPSAEAPQTPQIRARICQSFNKMLAEQGLIPTCGPSRRILGLIPLFAVVKEHLTTRLATNKAMNGVQAVSSEASSYWNLLKLFREHKMRLDWPKITSRLRSVTKTSGGWSLDATKTERKWAFVSARFHTRIPLEDENWKQIDVAMLYNEVRSTTASKTIFYIALPKLIRQRISQVIQWALYKVSRSDYGNTLEYASTRLRGELVKKVVSTVRNQLSLEQYQKGSLLHRIQQEPADCNLYLERRVRIEWSRLRLFNPVLGTPELLQLPAWAYQEESHEAFQLSHFVQLTEHDPALETSEPAIEESERGLSSLFSTLHKHQHTHREPHLENTNVESTRTNNRVSTDNSENPKVVFWLYASEQKRAPTGRVAGHITRYYETGLGAEWIRRGQDVEIARALTIQWIQECEFRPPERGSITPVWEWPGFQRLKYMFVDRLIKSAPKMNPRHLDATVCVFLCGDVLSPHVRHVKSIVKDSMADVWRDKMLHLLFLIDPEPWGKKEMKDILQKVDSALTFNFVGDLRDRLVAKGLSDEFASKSRILQAWIYVLLPEVAIEATKDAAESLRTIEQTAWEMFRENPDLLVLPGAEEIRNNGELPKRNIAAAELFRRLEDRHSKLVPSLRIMRRFYNDVMIRTRDANMSQEIIDTAVKCKVESPGIWNRLLATSNAEAFRIDSDFITFAEKEIRVGLNIQSSLDWLWKPGYVPHLSHAIESFQKHQPTAENSKMSGLDDSIAEGRKASLLHGLDETKAVPSGWTFQDALHVLSCRLQDPPPPDSEILKGLSFKLQAKPGLKIKPVNLSEGLREFCKTQGIPYPEKRTHNWTTKEEQILLKGTISKLTSSSITEHYLPNVLNASSHLSVLRERYPGKADTEILDILVRLHGDLTVRIIFWDRIRLVVGFPPKDTITLFQAILNHPEASVTAIGRFYLPAQHERNLLQHVKETRLRFPGYSDLRFWTS